MAEETKVVKFDESIVESVLVNGDLSKLSPRQKYQYACHLAKTLGLESTAMPFKILNLQGKQILYADKGTAEQLRSARGLSFGKPEYAVMQGDVLSVTISITDGKRTDYEEGAVSIANLKGEALANARMKALTKAKRRATLSFCGLGMMDESEISSIPNAEPVEIKPEETHTETDTQRLCTEAQRKLIMELIPNLPPDRKPKAEGFISQKTITYEQAAKAIDTMQKEILEYEHDTDGLQN